MQSKVKIILISIITILLIYFLWRKYRLHKCLENFDDAFPPATMYNQEKIDTEGHELQVILGIGKYIKNIKCILVEFHLDDIYMNYQPKKIHNFLIKNNFILRKKIKFPFTTWEDRIYIKN